MIQNFFQLFHLHKISLDIKIEVAINRCFIFSQNYSFLIDEIHTYIHKIFASVILVQLWCLTSVNLDKCNSCFQILGSHLAENHYVLEFLGREKIIYEDLVYDEIFSCANIFCICGKSCSFARFNSFLMLCNCGSGWARIFCVIKISSKIWFSSAVTILCFMQVKSKMFVQVNIWTKMNHIDKAPLWTHESVE